MDTCALDVSMAVEYGKKNNDFFLHIKKVTLCLEFNIIREINMKLLFMIFHFCVLTLVV